MNVHDHLNTIENLDELNALTAAAEKYGPKLTGDEQAAVNVKRIELQTEILNNAKPKDRKGIVKKWRENPSHNPAG